jgi:predicted phage terminase large subunit-like protein
MLADGVISTLADLENLERVYATLPRAEQARLRSAVERIRTSRAALEYEALVKSARTDLVSFCQATMPDISAKATGFKSRYIPALHHRAIGAAYQKCESGDWQNLIVEMPPRHGKSEMASKRGVPWFVGKDPTRQVIWATYNDDFAGDNGRAMREIVRSTEYQQIFPDSVLKKGSQAQDRLEFTHGGAIFPVGRGSAITGRGADLAVIDDPIKGRQEAESPAVRNLLWGWFNDDIYTRLLSDGGRVIIIMTRWHEDDLVGRLTDPNNPHYTEAEARKWRILSLPALAREDDPLGRKVGEALWPARFPAPYLEAIRERNPRGFASLYQGRPAPDDGDYFRAAWLATYKSPTELPKNLRKFAASDHAVSTKQQADKTCMGVGGIDEDGVLWIYPDLEWGRFPTDVTVERMMRLMRQHRPITWWAENEHISKAFGPFLRKRMMDEHVNCAVEPVTASKDKQTTGQAIRGLLAMGRVRFPAFAPWWNDAKDELLKFPNANHDDFVSFVSLLGLGADRMIVGRERMAKVSEPEARTMGWIRALTKRQEAGEAPKFGGY